MARAKKTDRAEARRRARLTAASGSSDAEAAEGRTVAGSGSSAVPSTRPGMFGSLRAAIRPVDLRSDVRQIPWLVTRTYAVILPGALIIGAAAWFGATGGASLRDISGIVFNLFVFPPPLAAAFLAGILAPRMSYLAGAIVGIVAAVVFSVYLAVGPIPGTPLTLEARQSYILYAIFISPTSGLAIGGFAGFYRRFLRIAGPARQQQGRKGAKASARR